MGRAEEDSQTVERSITLSELVKVLVEEIMSHGLGKQLEAHDQSSGPVTGEGPFVILPWWEDRRWCSWDSLLTTLCHS